MILSKLTAQTTNLSKRPINCFESSKYFGVNLESYLNGLQRFQNKAIQIIADSKLRISIIPQYHKQGILKLPELYT